MPEMNPEVQAGFRRPQSQRVVEASSRIISGTEDLQLVFSPPSAGHDGGTRSTRPSLSAGAPTRLLRRASLAPDHRPARLGAHKRHTPPYGPVSPGWSLSLTFASVLTSSARWWCTPAAWRRPASSETDGEYFCAPPSISPYGFRTRSNAVGSQCANH
jgi:hypothetical protein